MSWKKFEYLVWRETSFLWTQWWAELECLKALSDSREDVEAFHSQVHRGLDRTSWKTLTTDQRLAAATPLQIPLRLVKWERVIDSQTFLNGAPWRYHPDHVSQSSERKMALVKILLCYGSSRILLRATATCIQPSPYEKKDSYHGLIHYATMNKVVQTVSDDVWHS